MRSARTFPSGWLTALLLLLPATGWATHAVMPINLTQRNSDASALCAGCGANTNSVELTASSDPATCGTGVTYLLDLELRLTSQAFTGTPTHTSAGMTKSSCVEQQYPWIAITGLASGYYKWQARERTSSASSWALFNGGATGFIVAGPPVKLGYPSAPQTLATGACSAAVTVQSQDSSGVASPLAVATAISLARSSATMTLYSNSTCTTVVSSVTIAAGTSAASFYFRDTTAGSPTITASGGGLTSAIQTETIRGSQLAFTTAPQLVLDNACSAIATVQNQTGAGAPLNVAAATTVSLSSTSATLVFYSNPTCTTAVTSATIAAGASTASFYFKDPTFGYPVITAAAALIVPASQAEEITTPAPSELPWQTNEYGTLSINVAYNYNMGYQFTPLYSGRITRLCGYFSGTKNVRLYNRTSGAVLALASVTSANAWSCAPIQQITVTAGTSYSVAVELGGTGATYRSLPAPGLPQTYGSIRIDGSCYRSASILEPCASTGGITTTMYGQADIGFIPDPPTRLAIVSPAQSLVAGGCSAPVTVESQTATIPAPVSTATPIALTSSTGTTAFFAASDTTCATPLSSVTLGVGSSQVQFRFRHPSTGSVTLTASATGLTPASQAQTLTSTRLVFLTAPQTVLYGACSAIATVQNQTGSGAASSVAVATPVGLSSTSGSLGFYSDSGCTTAISSVVLPAGGSSASFYFKDPSFGSPTITAASTGITSGTQVATITSPPPSELPWQTNEYGTLTTNVAYDYNMGYAFTPLSGGRVTRLCGYYSGTKNVRLFNRNTGAVLATASVTSAYAWSCTPILPVAVVVGGSYSVAVELANVGATYRSLGTPPLPQTYNSIRIDGSCYIYQAITEPCIDSGLITTTMYGQVDIGFIADPPIQLGIVSPPQSVVAAGCSAPVTVESQSVSGPAPVAAATPVALSSSAGTTTFYAATDTTCLSPLTSVTLAAGATQVQFRFKDTAAGSRTVTATASGLTPGSQVETITASRLVFTSAAQNVSVGLCSALATIQNQNGAGAAVAVAAATSVALSSSSAAGTFYSDASCSTPISAVTIAAGGSTASFYFKDLNTGAITLTAAATGITPGAQGATILPCTPYQTPLATNATGSVTTGLALSTNAGYSFTPTSPVTLDALCGYFSGTKTVYLFNRSTGAILATTSVTSANSWSCATIVPLQLNAGTSYTVAVNNAGAGASERDLGSPSNRHLPKTWGNITINYACSGAAGATDPCNSSTDIRYMRGQVDIRIAPESVTGLAISSAPQTIPASSCSGSTTIQTRGCNGSLQRVSAATGITLTSTAATTSFYADSDTACATPIASVTVPTNGGTVRFRFKDTALGTPTLTASATGLTSGTQTETIVAAGPSRVAFSTPPRTVAAGACSPITTVQAQDAAGNPSNVTTATAVNLATSAAATGRFYSNSTCTTLITSVTIAAGTNSASLYFRDTLAGTPTFTATPSGLGSGTQVQTIVPAPASVLQFSSASQSIVAGACSALAGLRTQDGYGNLSPVGVATAVTLGSSSATGTFYSDAACTSPVSGVTFAAGTSTAGFYFLDTRIGAATLTASATGYTGASQSANFNPGPPAAIAFVNPTLGLTAGSCSAAISVRAQDAYGNPANVGAATTVTLATTSAVGSFYQTGTCGTPIGSATIAAGTSTVTLYYGDTLAGAPTLSASAAGLGTDTLVATVSAGGPSRLAFASGAQTLAAGSCSALATAESRDAFNNPSPVGAATAVSLGSSSTGGSFYSNPTCTTAIGSTTLVAGSSTAGFYFKDSAVGTPTLTLAATGFSNATQLQTITAAAPSRLVFLTGSQTLTAGGCSAIATVQTRDAFNNVATVAAATSATLSINSSGGSFYSDPGCSSAVASITVPAGASTASFYFKDTLAGSHTLTAASTGLTSATQGDVVNAAAPNRLAFTSAPKSLAAGACSTAVVVGAQDVYANPSAVAAATSIALGSSSTGDTFYSDSTCSTVVTAVTMGAGASAVSLYFRDTVAGSPTLTAAGGGLASGTQVQTVSAAAPSRLVFTTAAQTLTAGSCSSVAGVQSRDAFNNPSNVGSTISVGLSSTSAGGTFFSDAACTTAVSAFTIALGGNSGSFYFKDSSVGTPTITAAATGLISATQAETINAPSSTKLVFITTAQTIAAGACSAITTVQSQDIFGAPANVGTNTPVGLSSSSAAGSFHSDPGCTAAISGVTIAAGTSTASLYFKDTTAGSPTLTAASTGFTSANQGETINPATASRLAFLSAPQSLTTGSCSAAATVQSRDAFNNPSAVAAATPVALSSSAGGSTFYSDPACSVAAGGFTLAAGTNSGSFYFRVTVAGPATLTAAATGFTSGTQAQTITPGAPGKVAFTTAAKSQLAGACSTLATLQIQDSFNNPSNVAAPTAISLTTSSTGGTFYSDAACGVAIASVTVAAGASSAGFYFRDTRSGTPTLTAASTGLTSATQVETITPAPAVGLYFTTAPKTLTAGTCSTATTTQTRDSYGNSSAVTATTTLGYSAAPATITFYSNSTCTTAVTTLTMATGTANRTFYFRGNTSGAPVLTVAAAGLTSATQTATINAGAPSSLAFTTAAQTVVAGGCAAITTVQSRDSLNNPAAVAAATAVTLSDSSGAGTFYSNSTCTTAVAGITIAAGSSSASFYWRDTRSGSSILTAAATGLTSATQTETITAAPAAKLAIRTPAQTITAGACSAVVTVESQDSFSNPSIVPTSRAIDLTTTSSGGSFYSNSTCTTGVTQVTLAAGTSSAGFYFKDTRTGTATLTAASTGLTSATQLETITPAGASALAFLSAPQTVSAGGCSAAATIQSRDAYGNPAQVAAATSVTLSTSSSGGSFFSDAACAVAASAATIAAASSSASFYFRDTRAGAPTLTASATGFTNGSQGQTITPAAPARLVYLSAAQTVVAGVCTGSALTVQSQDGFGNPANVAAATAVNLSSDSATTSFSAGAGCGTPTSGITLSAGTSTASFFFKDPTAGSPTLSAAAVGLTAATQLQTVNPGAPAGLAFLTSAQTLAAGACSAQATVHERDSFGNPTLATASTLVSFSSSAGTTRFFSDAACTTQVSSATIDPGEGEARFYFSDSAAGAPTLTAGAPGLSFATQVQTIVAGAPTRLAFLSAAQTLTAGACSAVATIQSRDANNNPSMVAAATSVALSSSSTGGSFYSDAACASATASVTIAAGASTATLYFRDTRAGAPTLTAAASGLTSATQVQTINAAAVSRVAFSSAPQTIAAGACSGPLSVQAQDGFGNPAAVAAATPVGLSSSSATNGFFSNPTCTTAVGAVTLAAGSTTATVYFRDTRAGTPTLTAAAGGLTSGTQVETVTAAAPARLAFATAAQTLSAGACSAVTITQTRDSFDNPAAVAAATAISLTTSSTGGGFYFDAACTTAVTSVTVPAGAFSASFYFRDDNAGTPTLTATAAGLTPVSQVQTINPAAASRLVFTSAAQNLSAGACSAITSVQSRDAAGNPSNVATATTVGLTSNSTGGSFYSNATCTVAITAATIAAGTSTTSFYFKDTRAGTPTITTAATGFTSATQTQTINPAAATRLVFTTPPRTLTAGACSALTTVQSQDPYSNPSNVTASTAVTLSSSSPGGTFYSDAACATAIAGATIPAGTRVANFYFKDTRAGAPTLTAAATGLASATQGATINPAAPARLVFVTAAQTLAAGACSAVATLQAQDSFGNASAVSAATAISLTSSSAGGTFYSGAGCAGPIAGLTLAAGSSGAGFYFRDSNAGGPTLTAAAAGLGNATQLQTINPAAPAALAFVTGSQTLTAGACSAVVTVRSQDAFGNPAAVAAATPVTFGSSSSGGSFYSNPTCTTGVTGTTLAAGTSTASLYFKDTRAGGPTLTASATGLTSDTQSETINPAAPSRFAFINSPLTLVAGSCSAAITIEAQDTYGNASALTGSTAVTLTTSSTGGTFYQTGTCGNPIAAVTLGAGSTTASFRYGDTRAGTPTFTASASGFTSGTQLATVTAAGASKLVFTTAAVTLSAGSCSGALSLQAQDPFSNPAAVTSATAISLSSSSAGGTFSAAAGCAAAVTSVTLSAGSSAVSFFLRDTRAGTPTITAATAALGSVSQLEQINAAAPARLAFLTPAQSLVAGACSAIVNLQTEDSFANPSAVAAATAIALSTSSTGGTFYSDPTCSTAVGSTTVAAGSSGAGFYFRDTRSGAPTITIASGALTGATQVETISAASPTRLAFTTPSRTVVAGGCSAVVRVQAQDGFGNPAPVAAATSVTVSSSSSGGSFFSDPNCNTAIAAASIPAGNTTASFYFEDTRAGSPSLTTTAAGLTPTSQTQTVSPAGPARLAFLTAPQTLTAGGCSAINTLQSQDPFGNPAAVTAATPTALASSSAAGGFFSDPGCTVAIGGISLAAGTSSGGFYYRDTDSGTPGLTATATGLTPALQSQTVNPAAPSRLVFLTPAQTLTAGACSAGAVLQTRDPFDNPSAVASATAVSLSTSSSGGTFFTDPACSLPAASVTVAAGTSGATFYFRDTRTGTPTLTAAAGGLASATQGQTINAAGASKLAFTTASQSLTAGQCSAVTSLQTQDPFSNPASLAAPATVALSTNSSAGAFYSDASCSTLITQVSIPAGASAAGFYFKDTTAGAPTLTAAAAGLTAASQLETISPAAASKLAFITLAQSLTAGSCSARVQVQSQDSFSNPSNVAATPVGLSSGAATMRFYSDAACTVQVSAASIAAGTHTTGFYFRDTFAATPTITASAPGLGSAAQVETINPAAAARLVFTTPPRTVIAGACSLLFTLQSQDNLSNPSNVTAATALSLATSSTGGTFYSDPGCTTAVTTTTIAAGLNSASAYFRDTQAGAPTLSAAASGFASAAQAQTVSAAPPARLVFLTPSQSLLANGCSAVATVQAQDAFGNPSAVTAATVAGLATSSTGGSFFSNPSCTTAATTATLAAGANSAGFYFKDTRAGSPTLTVSSGSLTPATQVETISAAAATRLVFSSAPQTVVAGSCSALASLQSQDAFNNPASVTAATSIALTTTAATGGFYSDPACTLAVASATVAAGASTAGFYFLDPRAGAPTLTATAAGLSPVSQAETITAAAPARLVFTSAAQSLAAGSCSAVTILQAQDSFGNPSNVAAATTVSLVSSSTGGTFSALAGCATTTGSVNLAAGTSTISFYFRDTRLGSPTLTASAPGVSSASQVETITPAAPSKLVFTTSSQTRVAGTCSAAASLQTQDAFDNVAPVTTATVVSLSSSSSGGSFFSDPACGTAVGAITLAAGASSGTFYFQDTVAGAPTLTAAAPSVTAATQAQTITAASPTRLAFVTAPQSVTAGACSALATVQSQDTFGNPAAVTAATSVALSTSSADGTFYADAACTVAVSTRSIAAAGTNAGFYFKDTRAGTATLTAAATGLTGIGQAATITPAAPAKLVFLTSPQTILAGACSAAVTLQSRDAFDNPSPVAPGRTVALSSSSPTGSFSTAAGCATAASSVNLAAGTSTATFYFKDSAAGSSTLTASTAGLTPASQLATVISAGPAAIVFTTSAQTLAAGACSALTGLQTRDGFGNPANVAAATTIALASSSSGGGFFSDSTCLSAISSVIVAAGTNSRTFYFRDTRAGAPTLTASSGTLTPATQGATITAAAPSVLAFTTAAQTRVAGACSAITSLQTRDPFANPSAVSAATVVSLSSSSNPGRFYSDSGCANLITTISIPAGASGGSFYFRDTRAGTPTLTASATGFTPATQVQTITPAPVSRLEFATAAQTVTAGACSALATVRPQDSYGNPVMVSAATAVSLTSSSPQGTFYADPACGTAVSGTTIAAGASSGSFWFKDSRTGAPTLTAAAAGLTPATQVETIRAASASRLAYLTPAQTLPAGGCSAVLTVQSQDAFGNPANVGASILLTLSSSSAAGSFYADASCNSPVAAVTVVVGTNTASFYYQDTRAGSSTATASSTGLTAAAQSETINPAAPAKLAFVSAPQSVAASACSGLTTVQSQDAYGNPSPVSAASTVGLSSSSATGTFSTAAGCGTAVTTLTLGAGQSGLNFYFKDPAAGTPTLSATIPGLASATQVETITVSAPTALVFVTPVQTLNAGACSSVMTVRSRDASGNPSPATAATAVGLTASSGSGAFFADPACGTAITSRTLAVGASELSFYFKDPSVGAPTVTAAATGLSPASQVVTITTAGSAARLAFLSPVQSVVAGACSAVAQVQSQDSFGNAVSVSAATLVALSSSSASGTFFSDPGCTVPSAAVSIPAGGNTTGFYFKDPRSGTPTLTAAAAGLSNATQLETIVAGAPVRLVFVSPPQTLEAGACSAAISVQSQDAFGNASAITSVRSISLLTSSAGGSFYSDPACGALATGTAISAGATDAIFHYRDTRAGSVVLTAGSAGLASGTQTQTVTAGPQSALVFTTLAQTVSAGGCSALATVQLRDALGNPSPVSAATLVALASTSSSGTFYSDPLCNTVVTGRTVPAGAANASFYFKDPVVGSPTLTASSPGVSSATQIQTVIAGSASALAIITPAQTIAAGDCSAAITAEARDDLGNTSTVTSATAVVPSSSAGTGSFYSDPACAISAASVIIPTGASQASFYYRDTRVGTPTVTTSNPGLTSASQGQTIIPAPASQLVFLTAAQTVQVSACSAIATLQTHDAFGNPSKVAAAGAVMLSASSGTFTFYADSLCATAISGLTVAADTTDVSFYFKDTKAGPATVTASGTGLAAVSQTEQLTAGSAVAIGFATAPRTVGAGACSAVVTIEGRDAQGNPAQATAAQTVTLSSSVSTTAFFADPACATPATTITLAAGSPGADFYFQDSTLGAPILTATTPGLGSATQTESVISSTPVKLAFSSAPVTVTAGLCSGAVTIQTRDSFDNPSVATAAVALTVTASSATLAFFSDPACATALVAPQLAAGQLTTQLYFRDPTRGSPTLTAAATGFTSGTQVQTVEAAAPTSLFFATAPQTVPIGVCSAAVTIEVRDALANASPVPAPLRIALSSSSTGGNFYSDVGCTIPVVALNLTAGQDRGDFYFTDALPGTPKLTALAIGLTSASQDETIIASGPAVKLAFVTAPITVEAGSCSEAISIWIEDAAGSASPIATATQVALTTGSTVAGLYADPACATGVTALTIPPNDYRATFYLKDAVVEPVVVNVLAAGLTGASQTQTVICPAAVDGAFCDDSDRCNGRETCQAGACAPSTPLVCDDQDACTTDSCSAAIGCVNAVTQSCCRSPGITRDANLFAAVGVPYRFNPAGLPTLTKGTGPISWAACASGPAGLFVDATTGAINWTPTAAGPTALCIQSTGACGTDTYTFTVDVTATPPVAPVASITIEGSVAINTPALASASASTPNPAFAYEWSFGDGTTLSTGMEATHSWAKAGGYNVRLRVYDQVGQVAEAVAPVAVTDPGCLVPPRARILADRTTGTDTLAVAFTVDYSGADPSPVYRWRLGDGSTAVGAAVNHVFMPGSFEVSLLVVTAEGCTASDTISVVVNSGTNLAPHCAVTVSPATGPAPLATTFTASFGDADGKVSSASWLFSDGVSADAMLFGAVAGRVIDRPGRVTATLEVTDDRGVVCRASAEAEAGNGQSIFAPEILSVPTLTAQCGVAYVYGSDGTVRATGSRPISWSLGRGTTGKPEGMTLDEKGLVTWTPPAGKRSTERVTVVAQNSASTVEQDFLVKVECATAGGGCGCSSGAPAGSLALFGLAALAFAARRRRARAPSDPRP